MRWLFKQTSYHAYFVCISYELLSFCILGCIRQLQINAIQFPSLIPNIMIKIPTAFVRPIRVAPCWEITRVFYDSDRVAVPFVAIPLIFDSWHSNVVLSIWMLLLSVSARLCKKVHRFSAAGKDRSSKNIMRVLPGPLSAWSFYRRGEKYFVLLVRAQRLYLGLTLCCLNICTLLHN